MSISYPLYPDNINYAAVIFNEVSWKILITLYFTILWQEKIIIITSKFEKVSLIVETLFKLMYPLDTSIYKMISFISEEMVDFIQAPFPYIVGWSPSVFQTIKSYNYQEIENEIVMLNIDKNEVYWKHEVKFPNPQTDYWKSKFNDLK